MTNKKEKQSLYKWIFSSYVRTAVVPLIFVQLIIVLIYFGTNVWSRQQMNRYFNEEVQTDLERITKSEGDSIQEQLMSVTNATELYRTMTEDALLEPAIETERDRLAFTSDGIYYTTKNTPQDGAAIFFSGIYPIESEGVQKVDKVLQTQNLMKKIKQSQPLSAAIYFNSFDSLNIIYPYFDVLSQYAPFMDIPKYNFYYEADGENNPNREVVWTDVYLDPAGNGWMVSSIAPVYNKDFLEGVVGIDVTVSNIIGQVLQLEIPYEGYGILVGKDGTILALPSRGEADFGLNELTEHSYDQAILQDTFKPNDFNVFINPSFSNIASDIKDQPNGNSTININGSNRVVSWATIEETEWKLLIFVEENNVYAKVTQTVNVLNVVGWLMLLGLVVLYIVFVYVLSKRTINISHNISKPLMEMNALVKKIGDGAYYQDEKVMEVFELEQTYNYLVDMGIQLGHANRQLIEVQDELRNNEAYLKALVNSIDDVILEVNEFGHILQVWTKDNRHVSTYFNDGQVNSIGLLVDENKAEEFVKKINQTIATGQSKTIEYKLMNENEENWFLAKISLVNEISRKAVVSSRDITDRIKMEKTLVQAKDDAEKANRAKSTFLSNMSHELRTPLNAILGFAQIIEMDTGTPLSESQTSSIGQILGAGRHLLMLINEVLDLAKIESGKIMLSMEPVSVNAVIEEIYALMKPIADKNQIKLTLKYNVSDDLYVLADFTRIKQVLINLITNAIKYNKEEGSVNVSIEKSSSKVHFSVVDSGVGIPKDELAHIFKPFYRVSTKDTTIEGTGIGLAVAKQLIELMDGNIFVESSEGIGSRFTVELFLAKPVLDDTQNSKKTVIEHTKVLNSNQQTILYIEDNPANLTLVEKVIAHLPNISLMSSNKGEKCLALAIQNHPELILLDINLPGISGIDVLGLLKADARTKDIPVIAVSANAMAADIDKALELGFVEYITKPIDVSLFLDKIAKILNIEKS